jgi:Ca2+-binding RTX toxin-like protein
MATQFGTNGNDRLKGGGGNDQLYGGAGDDALLGGAGADHLDGGSGNDTASYYTSSAAVTVNLASGTGSGGDAQGDTFVSIENAVGSNFNDTLMGNDAANKLSGGDGNDTLKGGGGDDLLRGGTGADALYGGIGSDMATYDTSEFGVTANLETGRGYRGDAAGDTYSSIERLEGSSHDDYLIGNSGDNGLYGGNGKDILEGRSGNDVLKGGGGDDKLVGGMGRDTLQGDAGSDVFVFNSTAESGNTAATRDVIVDFQNGADHIDLSGIDARANTAGNDAFAWRGNDVAFSGQAGELHANHTFANNSWTTVVEMDTNGDRVADSQIELSGYHTMSSSDFIL